MRIKGLRMLPLMMLLGVNFAMAQVNFTQTTTSDFMQGTGLNVNIADDCVSVQGKLQSLSDWNATTNLPQNLKNHQVTTWHNYVYLLGGYNGSSEVNTVYRATQEATGISGWTTLNALPVALKDMAVVATQTHLYVIGGRNSEGVSDKVYSAQLGDNGNISSWETLDLTLPQPVWGCRAVFVMGNVYLIGGANVDDVNAVSNKVYRLTVNASGEIASINEMANLPAARNGHAVAVYDSKIIVTGGYDASHTAQNTVYVASVNLNGTLANWQMQTSLNEPVFDHSAVCTNGVLVLIGGHNGSLPINSCYITDLANTSYEWNAADILLPERYTQGTAFAFGNKIFFSGGQSISESINNAVRYMPVNTGAQVVAKSAFVSLPFDIGTPKNLQQLSYSLTYVSSTTSYEILYRMAGPDRVFGSWISAGSNLPVIINQSYSYIQYMFRFTANSTDNLSLADVTLTLTGFTQLAGNLNNSFSITLAGSPYLVTEDISFTSGVHQIEAGVVIQFMPNTGMIIGQASVFFNGTQASPILLTSNGGAGNFWKGVHFQDSSDSSVASVMSYTNIEYGGQGDEYNANLYLYYTNTPAISNCSFSHADGHGIRLQNANPTFMNIVVDDNAENGLYIHNSVPTCNSCTISNNGNAGIYYATTNFNTAFQAVTLSGNLYGIYSCSPDRSFIFEPDNVSFGDNDTDIAVAGGQIGSNQTWNYYANGYVLFGNVEVYGGTPKLTIGAGTTIKVKENYALYVGRNNNQGGMLYAVGTATAPITFTSYNGEVGGWNGLQFRDGSDYNSSSSLRYCIVEKGNTNMYCGSTNQPSVMHCTFQDAVNQNIQLDNASINLEESIVKDAPIGLWSQTSQPTLISDTFENLSQYAIYYNNTGYEATYYSCTLKDSRVGIRYATPNMNVNNNDNVVFQNNNCNFALPGGTVSENRTWATSSYFIESSLEIRRSSSETCTLTINPGCTLKFATGAQMRMGYNGWGQLKAEGTNEQPILFTSMNGESGAWSGVLFDGGSDDDPLRGIDNSLKHCIIENAVDNFRAFGTTKPEVEDCIFRNASDRGIYFSSEFDRTMIRVTVENNGGNGIYAYNAPFKIQEGQIRSNGGYGIYIENSLIELHDVEIANNGNYAMYYNNIHYVSVLDATFTGNAVDGVRIEGGHMTESRNWNAHDYYIFGNVIVGRRDDVCRLTLSPGTNMRFAEGTNMQISVYIYYNQHYYGELNAIGNTSAPITFGPMNGETGGWNGLVFDDRSDNISGMESVLKYCIIEKGNDYNMHMSYTGQPAQIEHCIFRDAVGDGVYLYSSGAPTLQSCQLLNNGNYGLRLYYTSPVVKNTTIKDNASYGLYLEGNSNPTVGGNYTYGCDIYRNNGGNGGYEVYHNGSANISMPYNFFGSIDSVYIDQQLIYDKKEDNNKGRINVKPNSYMPINEANFDWSGHLYYDGNSSKPMADQTVEIRDYQNAVIVSAMTNNNGYFSFSNLNLGVATHLNLPGVTVTKVDATDAMLTMKHYTHLITLEGARLRAADVNLSYSVNGTDALLIQRRYGGDPVPAGDAQITSEAFTYDGEDLEDDLNVLWFGDVNGSYPNGRNGIQLQFDGQLVTDSHQQLVVPVRVKNVSALGAASLRFTYPEEFMEIEDVTINTANGSFMYNAGEGRLIVSWYDITPLALEDDALLFNITVTTKDLSALEVPIIFGLENNDSEFADGQGTAYSDAVMAMPALVTETLGINNVTDGAFSLTVYPNPMKDKATLAYTLPADGAVTLTVYNAMGQQMTVVVDERQTSGVHQVEVGLQQWASGIYYCRLTYGNLVEIIKMVVE